MKRYCLKEKNVRIIYFCSMQQQQQHTDCSKQFNLTANSVKRSHYEEQHYNTVITLKSIYLLKLVSLT